MFLVSRADTYAKEEMMSIDLRYLGWSKGPRKKHYAAMLARSEHEFADSERLYPVLLGLAEE